MVKRILCIFLLICIIIPAAVACTKKEVNEEQSTADTSDSETTKADDEEQSAADTSDSETTKADDEEQSAADTSDSETNDFAPVPYMADFGNFNFIVLTRGSGSFKSNDITGEITGDSLSQATYKRNQSLKKKYNFNIEEIQKGDWVSAAQVAGAAGEDTYHMWSFKLRDYAALALEGYLKDMNKINNMNLDAPYYDQGLRTQGTFADMLFFITGDMLYMDDLSTMSLCFNKDLWDQYRLSDVYDKNLYELVDSGEWTFEKYCTFVNKFGFDGDGDGDVDENDMLGQVYASQDILQLNVGMANSIISKDTNDLFVFNDSAKQMNDIDAIFELLRGQACKYAEDYTSTAFHDSRALFLGATFKAFPGKVETFAGLVPHPKYDETQESYYSFIHPHASNAIAIANAVVDIEKVASIIELTSYESMTTLTPEITEYIFTKLPDDVSDQRMVELICKNKTYDLSYTWHIDYGFEALRTLITDGTLRPASAVLNEGKNQIEATNKSYFNSMMRY